MNSEPTLTSLQNDRIDLEASITRQLVDFHRKYPLISIQLSCKRIWDDYQADVTLTLP